MAATKEWVEVLSKRADNLKHAYQQEVRILGTPRHRYEELRVRWQTYEEIIALMGGRPLTSETSRECEQREHELGEQETTT